MGQFLLDRVSFWLGFLAATLFWWLLGRLRPALPLLREKLKEKARAAREGTAAGTEACHRTDTLRMAQRQHLAAPMFSLDEVLILPSLLVPPPPVVPGIHPTYEEITSQALPYLADWPELAATYSAPRLSLAAALQGSANLVLVGRPGCGKTVALAHLASQVARRDPLPGGLHERIPFLVHAFDLVLPVQAVEDLLKPLQEAVVQNASNRILARLPEFLENAFKEGKALLLLDGMDELPAEDFARTTEYLERLLQKFPKVQAVATALPDHTGGLIALGFNCLALSAWDERQRSELILKWSDLWQKHGGVNQESSEYVHPLILTGWLLNEPAVFSPLELTLRVWGANAGDTSGRGVPHAIETHIRRMCHGIPQGKLALGQLAVQMLRTGKPCLTRREAEGWVAEYEPALPADPSEEGGDPGDGLPTERQEQVRISRLIPALVESGLVRSHPGSRLSCAHPVLAGYLAGMSLGPQAGGRELVKNWLHEDLDGPALRTLGQEYYFSIQDGAEPISSWLGAAGDPLRHRLLTAARWLRSAPEKAAWRGVLLRSLAQALQAEGSPFGLRARCLAALATSGTAGVEVLFLQLAASQEGQVRQLAALGLGQVKDHKAVQTLHQLLSDPVPNVRRAACLALVQLDHPDALDCVADALLHGDEDLRRAAAEALANHPQEGYPALREASQMEDLMVRRAAIPGLMRVMQPWAVERIKQMQVEDPQWVVKNAAAQALEEMEKEKLRLPRPLPALHAVPWLIAFAGERGLGVAPGKAAQDLLRLALEEGSEEQRLAAMDTASRRGETGAIQPIAQIYYTNRGELKNAAYEALRQLASTGSKLPETEQVLD